MSGINHQCDPAVGHAAAETPCLAQLRLTSDDLAALRRQGFVTAEPRGDRTYFKLRFRRDRQQVVRYVGCDPDHAAAVQQELNILREERRKELELSRLTDAANTVLRQSKRALAPVLAEEGFAFHGYEIRRRRSPRAKSEKSAPYGEYCSSSHSQEKMEDVDQGKRGQSNGRNVDSRYCRNST